MKSLARDLEGDKEIATQPSGKGSARWTNAGDYFSNSPLDQWWLKFAELENNANVEHG